MPVKYSNINQLGASVGMVINAYAFNLSKKYNFASEFK